MVCRRRRSAEKTERKARVIERYCQLLPDSIATHQEWRRLVVVYSVKGVEVHDTKLVASMIVHGINSLLTFDTYDFKRYPGILVVSPADVK